MPTINSAENLIRVTPPIQWSEIQDGPPLTALEMVFEGPEAVGIRAVSGARIDSYLDRELQKVVNHYAGHTFGGRIEIRNERVQGTMAVRVVVRGQYVVRLEAVLGWPPEQVDDTGESEGHLMEILTERNVHVADERYVPADETDLPDVLLAWRDAAVKAALAGNGTPSTFPGTFSITWDHDFVSLWCTNCPGDERPVDAFPGNPTDMAEVFEAMKTHTATHEERS